MNIGIIGGGFAGMTAAYELGKLGYKTVIFERMTELGGLASTFQVEPGVPLERGYHHWFTSDTHVVAQMHELGLGDRVQWIPSKTGWFEQGKIWSMVSPSDLLKLGTIPLLDRIRLGAATAYLTYLQRDKNNLPKYESITAHDWWKKYTGDNVWDKVWGPMFRGKFGARADEVPMVWHWFKIVLRIGSRRGLNKEELGYPRGSFQVLIDALEQAIVNQGGIILKGATVKRVVVENNVAVGIEPAEDENTRNALARVGAIHESPLHVARARGGTIHESPLHAARARGGTIHESPLHVARARGGTIHESPLHAARARGGTIHESPLRINERGYIPFDRVYSSAPSFATLKFVHELPSDYVAKMNEAKYMGAVLIILKLKQQMTPWYWLNIADRSMPFVATIEQTNFIPPEVYNNKHIMYVSNYLDASSPYFQMSREELFNAYVPHLKKLNPSFTPDWVEEFWHFKEAAAQPVFPLHYSQKIPPLRTPIRNFYLGNTTQIYPEDRGTNYSVRLGQDIARLIDTDAKSGGWGADM